MSNSQRQNHIFFYLDVACEAAKKNQAEFFFIPEWYTPKPPKPQRSRPMFSFCKDSAAFLDYYRQICKQPCAGVCELTFADQRMRLYVDLDDKIKIDPAGLDPEEPVIRVVAAAMKEALVSQGLCDPEFGLEYVTAIGSRPLPADKLYKYKYSAHIVFQNVTAESRSAIRRFMEPLCQQNPMIDYSVYTSKKSSRAFVSLGLTNGTIQQKHRSSLSQNIRRTQRVNWRTSLSKSLRRVSTRTSA